MMPRRAAVCSLPQFRDEEAGSVRCASSPMTSFYSIPNCSLWRRVAGTLGQVLTCLAPGTLARWRWPGGRRWLRRGRIPEVVGLPPKPPHRAGPARSRHATLPRRVLRTGSSGVAGPGRRVRGRTAPAAPPVPAPGAGGPCTSPAHRQRRGGRPRRERCRCGDAAAHSSPPAARGIGEIRRARRAGSSGRSPRPQGWAASWQACHDSKAEPPVGRP